MSHPAPALAIPAFRLARLRLHLVMTRSELAAASGLSQSRIQQLESGVAPLVRPTTARKLAAALGVSVHELCDLQGADTAEVAQ